MIEIRICEIMMNENERYCKTPNDKLFKGFAIGNDRKFSIRDQGSN